MPFIDSGFGNRAIAANHLRSFPKRSIYLDTETQSSPHPQGEMHTLKLAWTCRVRYDSSLRATGEEWQSFTDAKELCAYICLQARPKDPLYVYGHNLYFDLQVAEWFFWLPQWGWKLEFIYEEGLTFIMVVSREGARIKAVSTTNYFDTSLRELGKSVGLGKASVDFKTASNQELSAYCRGDVEIVRAAMEQYMSFNRSHDTGRFSLTKASQALACFRHRFLPSLLDVHSHQAVIDLERSSYFGGRTECFQLGKIEGGPFRFYDVNSMYPAVMRSRRYPTRLLRYYKEAHLAELERFKDTACIIAEVTLATLEPAYAVRLEGKVCFPVGRFRTTLCTESFWKAVEEGSLSKIHSAAVYQADYIFRDYVDYWWPLKERYSKEGNALYKRIVKIFLNALYGKFGQRGYVTEELEAPSFEGDYMLQEADLTTGERWREYSFFNRAWRTKEEGNARNTFVAVAAHVTEYGRNALWALLTGVGLQRVLYCDTDSLVVRARDGDRIDRLFRSTGLGALALDKECGSLVFHGLKDYQADGVKTIKGVPHEAKQLSEDCYEYSSWPGLATHRSLGLNRGYLVRRTRKRLQRTYDKGVVGAEGKVSPLVLEEP